MSFDLKYDKDGMPIKSAAVQESIAQAAALFEQPAPVANIEVAQVFETQTQTEPEVLENQGEEALEEVVEQPSLKAETSQAKNFRVIRERAERAERERDELMRMLSQNEKPQVVEPEEDLSFNVEADALVEGKHLSKVEKKIKILEQKLAQYEQKSTASNAETRLKSQYADFDSVVTAENIATLRDDYPELAQALIATPDLYAKGKSAYMLLKKFGIAQDPLVRAEKAIVQKNAAKPRPLASVSPQQGSTPLAQANAFANGLTKELREQLAREVSEARRNM